MSRDPPPDKGFDESDPGCPYPGPAGAGIIRDDLNPEDKAGREGSHAKPAGPVPGPVAVWRVFLYNR